MAVTCIDPASRCGDRWQGWRQEHGPTGVQEDELRWVVAGSFARVAESAAANSWWAVTTEGAGTAVDTSDSSWAGSSSAARPRCRPGMFRSRARPSVCGVSAG